MILASELAEVLKKKQLSMSTKEIQEMIQEVDYHGNGKINYSEFLSATINVRTFMTEQKMQAIFQQFDTDNSGKITQENIYFAMQKLGQEISRDEIEDMIKKHDIKGDGVLSFEEFKAIFLGEEEAEEEYMNNNEAPWNSQKGREGPQINVDGM